MKSLTNLTEAFETAIGLANGAFEQHRQAATFREGTASQIDCLQAAAIYENAFKTSCKLIANVTRIVDAHLGTQELIQRVGK